MTLDDIRVGAFRLHEPIAEGGMGMIWAGEHVAQGLPVAVKFMKPTDGNSEEFVQAFRREVRAVASLRHPHIIGVFDSGTVETALPGVSSEHVPVGSPYLVMERAFGGTLSDRMSGMAWPFLHEVTTALLDALAHAHARGVVHRDLKPSNILLGVGDDRQLRLTDFGLAFPRDVDLRATRHNMVLTHAGTPNYMAPEQALGTWRDFTPATDLYALGCVLWYLVTGRRPFKRSNTAQTIFAQLESEPPGFVPRFPCPEGYEDFLRRLLRKRASERPQRAVEAFMELQQLARGWEPPSGEAAGRIPAKDPSEEPTELITEALETRSASGSGLGLFPSTLHGLMIPSLNLTQDDRIRLPLDWRHPEPAPPPLRLLGAGLGLYGNRDIPLVGREEERDRLWSVLREVQEGGVCRVVLLEGPAGCGKSRLARWLGERADEVMGVSSFRGVHSPTGARCDGLGPMVSRAFSCVGLTSQEIVTRLDGVLAAEGFDGGEDEAAALCELIRPFVDGPGEAVARPLTFEGPVQRYAALERMLRRQAQRRTPVVWIDDAQWAPEALAFVEYLLGQVETAPFPCLVLLTARREALAIQPRERRALDDLLEYDVVETLPVEALAAKDGEALVAQLLPLEERLARRIVDRTGGNPLFATHLLGDWVQRELLEASPEGFALRDSSEPSLPDDLHAVWLRRIERVLIGWTQAERRALDLAFTLGQDIDIQEWLAVCQLESISPAPGLLDRLLDEGLAKLWPGGRGFSLVHGMLRESALRLLSERGELEAAHRSCAAFLSEVGDIRVDLRLARHLIAAGEVSAALGHLAAGERFLFRSGGYRLVPGVLDEWEAALDRLKLSEDDPRRAYYLYRRASLDKELHGDDTGLRALAEKVELPGWEEVRVLRLLDVAPWMKPEEAVGELRSCLDLLPDGILRLRLRTALAKVLARLGRAEEAQAEIAIYRSMDRENLPLIDRVSVAAETAHAAGFLREFEDSLSFIQESLEAAQSLGARRAEAFSLSDKSEILRGLGRPQEALSCSRRAVEILEAFDPGSRGSFIIRMNLAVTSVEAGAYDEGRGLAQRLLAERANISAYLRSMLLLVIGASHAASSRWPDWELTFSELEALDWDGLRIDPDHASLALTTARLLIEGQQAERAEGVLQLARRLYSGLRDSEGVARVDALMQGLPVPP